MNKNQIEACFLDVLFCRRPPGLVGVARRLIPRALAGKGLHNLNFKNGSRGGFESLRRDTHVRKRGDKQN
jgi:hypothetical protein